MSFSTALRPRRYRVVWRIDTAIGFALILLLLLVQRSPAHSNGIDLVYFRADCLAGQPEVYISWETAHEWDVVGFFVSRSLTATTAYTYASAFIPHEGDAITGAQYDWLDDTTELSYTYYYRLEVIHADQSLTLYGPLAITAGVDSTSMFFIPRAYLPLVMRAN